MRGQFVVLALLLLGRIAGVVLAEGAQAVLAWNVLMLDAIRADNTGPTVSTRNLALLHTSIYDAVNSIDGRHQPYQFYRQPTEPASPEAAVVSAGFEVMRVLYPTMNALTEALYAELRSNLPDGTETTVGLALGREIALETLGSRQDDGSSSIVPYIPSSEPGQWLRTPPFYRPPLDPHWRYVRPFCLGDIEPYVAPGPPPLASEAYARDFNEVKHLGARESPIRTAEQGEIAVFWSDFSYTAMPPGHWHEIAAKIAAEQENPLTECTRLMALMSLAQADAAIVCWEGKYRFNFWRPVTAIRRADEDYNPATDADPAWDALLPAPNFPEYPSGHSTFSKAGAQILTRFYGTDAILFSAFSDSLPGVTRTFQSLAACADEIGRSRIYGGFHFEFANRDGKASGAKVADFVAANFLLAHSTLPMLRMEGFAGLRPVLRVQGIVGEAYSVDATSDFVEWTPVASVTAVPGGVLCQDPEATGRPQRFYRVRSAQ